MAPMKAVLFLAIAGILLIGCIQQPGEKTANQPVNQTQKQIETPKQPGQDQPPTLPKYEADQPPALPTDDDNILPIPSDNQNSEATSAPNPNPKEFAGLWREFSSRMFYDAGGGGALGAGSGVPLEINSDGTWKFGGSAGKWQIEAIQGTDWKKWGVESYGPTRKMVLNGWNKDVADGPVEESDEGVDFIWAIYRVGSPTVSSPGQVQVKYGHSS